MGVCITVSDNGVGFKDDMVVDFPMLDSSKRVRPGMGLRYVITKLRHMFGDDYSFSVESAPWLRGQDRNGHAGCTA